MQEACLGQTLEAIERLKKQQPDINNIKKWLDDHSKDLHGKLDSHSKKHDNITKLLDTMPDHDTLMKGVHGLLADHMGDHSGKIMDEVNRLPLPPDEKVLLQAIENIQEAALDQTLEAIQKIKQPEVDLSRVQRWLDDHTKVLHKK